MKLPKFERRMEEFLVKVLAIALHLPEAHVEEIVVAPRARNPYLKGGIANAWIARTQEECYRGFIQIQVPCPVCQEHGGTYRSCGHQLKLCELIENIDPADVPAAFHRNIGQDPIEVGVWDWTK